MIKQTLPWLLGATVLSLLVGFFMSSCREPRTELMRKLEEAGAGDMQSVSSQSMEQWFHHHLNVAFEVNQTCYSLRAERPANWGDSIDGRICAAASKVQVFRYVPRPVDGMTFDAGR